MKKLIGFALLIICMLLTVSCGEEHEHSYYGNWSSDDTSHWHAASCEHTSERKDVATHSDSGNDGACDTCGKQYYTPLVEYTVSWYDENGVLIANEKIQQGTIPMRQHSVNDTTEWDYTFEGWATTASGTALNTLPSVSENCSYYAKVSKVKQKYTVSFVSGCDTSVPSQTVDYGTTINEPEKITYEGHRFIGWYTDSEFAIPADFTAPITNNAVYYACWNEVVDIGAYLEALLNGYALNPYSYIPESMRPTYSDNLVSIDDFDNDYSSFVSISDIKSHGFGEQWNMILSNINESMTFFNVLTVVEGLTSSSIVAFNNYIDKNPSDTATHSFKDGIYNVTIDFDGERILYVLDYTTELPALGEQTVQIYLEMDIESGERTTRIQLGDANALCYVMTESSYNFALKYLGVRRAYFEISRNDDGSTAGHIYEYLTIGENEFESAADFYITENYAYAIGNKADGLLGFTGTICETYDTQSGKLVGYEVEETLSSIVYNTLWFDLDTISGIQSIKYQAAQNKNPAKFFINGNSKEWTSMNVGSGLKMFSRRFDIEFRTQYFYAYDEATEKYVEIKASVPMLFIQEENYNTFSADVLSKNNLTASVSLTENELLQIMNSYDTLVPIFKTNKENVSAEDILNLIGEKITT